jgi:hypothetical protein
MVEERRHELYECGEAAHDIQQPFHPGRGTYPGVLIRHDLKAFQVKTAA